MNSASSLIDVSPVPPLVFGLVPRNNQTVSPDLVLKGINRLKTTISTTNMVGIPHMKQIAYQTYSALLPAFMKSAHEKQAFDARQVGYPIDNYMKLAECFPFDYPELVVSFYDAKVSDDQVALLVNQGATIDVIQERRVYTFKKPNTDIIKNLMRMEGINPITNAANEQTNLKALFGLRRTIQVFSAFFRAHTYPAYKDKDHFEDLTTMMLGDANPLKRPREEEDDEGITRGGQSRRTEESEDAATAEHNVPEGSVAPREDVVKIRHPPRYASKEEAFPTRTTMETTNGVFSPYFSDTQHYDSKMVPRVFKYFFLGCLGFDKKSISSGFDEFASQWGIIGNTEVGKVLTHMAACIELGIMSQARILPLFETNGRYIGAIIGGWGFTLRVGNEEFNPVPYNALVDEIDSTALHRNVLEKVLREAGFDLSDGMGEGVKILANKDLKAMELRKHLLEQQMTEAQRENAQKVAKALSFENPSWASNGTNIVKMFDLLETPIDQWPIETPIHPTVLFSTDKVEMALSCFGSLAPTMCPIEGRKIKVTAKTFDVVTRGRGGDSKVETRAFQSLNIRTVELRTAVADLKEIRQSGEVRILTNVRRSGRNEDRELRGTMFTEVLAKLKVYCGAGASTSVSSTQAITAAAGPSVQNLDDW